MITLSISKPPKSISALVETFVKYLYSRVDMVTTPGDFAVRGGIVDIFPVNQTHPIRIEFFDQSIDRMNTFDIQSQRSLSNLETTKVQKNDASVIQPQAIQWASQSESHHLKVDLSENDYVVHEDFGIGIYRGLNRMSVGSFEGEFAFIEYKGNDKIYVPIDKMNRLNKYHFGDIIPQLNSLQDEKWKRTKTKCQKATEMLAKDIYLMMKVRNETEGISFAEDTVWQVDLEQSFKHKETKDQLQAIEDVKLDMESSQTMDRLICGEVGYGKTEVLIRAAFKAIHSHKQVAVVVPTTILAFQHHKVFQERFKTFDIDVDIMSRFQSKSEITHTLGRLKSGESKIVIGTHRLLQKGVEFADLGLLIIDEEQRFGVRQKDQLKTIKKNVDVISVSATPIPRTLYMALSGGKTMSRIETPPKEKKPIATTVIPINNTTVKHFIDRELARSGQVFYLIQRVKDIDRTVQKLKNMLPYGVVDYIHGQMKENDLLEKMQRFMSKSIQILVCTTIIENGINIPNANTIIVEEIEMLGLGQIHQIKGRVGRADDQAYALLMYSDKELPTKAKKRIEAIKSLTGLGTGYQLAMKDLEIRGAGALLGSKQHGHISSVGFDLYCKLLTDAVEKTQQKASSSVTKILELKGLKKSFIPHQYIPSDSERLAIYQRLTTCKNHEILNDIKLELRDRFGPIPETVDTLLTHIRHQLDAWS